MLRLAYIATQSILLGAFLFSAMLWEESHRFASNVFWSGNGTRYELISGHGMFAVVVLDEWIWDDSFDLVISPADVHPAEEITKWPGFQPESRSSLAGLTTSSGIYTTSFRRVPPGHPGWPKTMLMLDVPYRLLAIPYWMICMVLLGFMLAFAATAHCCRKRC